MTVHKPRRLREGARIGIVAPAGCIDETALHLGIQPILRRGFQVELSENIAARKGYLAGEAEQRADDLRSFFLRDDIDAIFCARGGFGSVQLLSHIEIEEIARHAKIFVGYSDLTILLNVFLQKCSFVTFHGPMVAMDFARAMNEEYADHFWRMLTGQASETIFHIEEVIRPGRALAPIIGGCLSILITTLGTAYEVETAGNILFFEDIGEKPYRIERMLTHLKMAGKLNDVAGVVFGDFIDCDGEGLRDLRQIIGELFADAPYPVLTGLKAGHGRANLLLPFGVLTAIDAAAGTLRITEPVVC